MLGLLLLMGHNSVAIHRAPRSLDSEEWKRRVCEGIEGRQSIRCPRSGEGQGCTDVPVNSSIVPRGQKERAADTEPFGDFVEKRAKDRNWIAVS